MKVLVTSTSFQDSKGKHQDKLNNYVGEGNIDYLRGPLSEEQLNDIDWSYDTVVCGDDAYTDKILEKAVAGGLKVLSKYGVGLDKVDLDSAKSQSVLVRNCRGVNQATVAEHVFAMLLGLYKNLVPSYSETRQGHWKRLTGGELQSKKLGIIGLGGIGKEVAKRAKAFNMETLAFDRFYDQEFCTHWNVQTSSSVNQDFKDCEIITLHCNLNSESENLINKGFFSQFKRPIVLVNTARAGLIDRDALEGALENKKLAAYLTDVWFEEPMPSDEPLKNHDNVWITPHIGSRTRENVEKQGLMAVENMIESWESLK